jgi:hypothetical protein
LIETESRRLLMSSVVNQGGGNASKVLQNKSKNCVRRYSGERYINPPEKIQQIKEKYKNGVTMDVINEMLGIKE